MPKKSTKRILNILPSKATDEDWRLDNAVEAGMLSAALAVPASKDLREDWWKVGDQGSSGACVGWATGEGVLRWHFVQAGRISKSDSVAPRFLWMAAKETDEFNDRPTTFVEEDGTSLKAALDVARKYGAVLDDILPFSSGKLYQGNANTFYATASQLKIASYFNLFKNFTEWRKWLATSGPILAALTVDKTWNEAASTKGKLDVFQPATASGGHAVAIVGYKPDGRFIIRNSWGPSWGDKGFGFATEQYIQDAFFNEAYGVK